MPSFKVDTEDEDDNDEPGSDYTDSKQITYNDWVDMLDANNCYVYGEEEGHYTVANNALESPGSIIAANNGKIYVFISDGQGGWSSGSDIGQTGEVNLNFLFFRGSANDSDYSSLQYDESKGCYIYQDTYEMYFENGYLCKLVFGSNTMYITSYGEMSVDLSRITFPN